MVKLSIITLIGRIYDNYILLNIITRLNMVSDKGGLCGLAKTNYSDISQNRQEPTNYQS